MQGEHFKVAALERIGLGGVLGRNQIVGHRNDGEKDEDEQGQRDELGRATEAAVAATSRGPQPKAYQAGCDQGTREI